MSCAFRTACSTWVCFSFSVSLALLKRTQPISNPSNPVPRKHKIMPAALFFLHITAPPHVKPIAHPKTIIKMIINVTPYIVYFLFYYC